MRFRADTGVDARVAPWLNEQGHDVIHLRDENLHRLPNGEIFEKAAREARTLLTFDLDFGEIASLAAVLSPWSSSGSTTLAPLMSLPD